MASVSIADVMQYILRSELRGDITESQKGGTCRMHVKDQKFMKNVIPKT
jgi:hypothetical protein